MLFISFCLGQPYRIVLFLGLWLISRPRMSTRYIFKMKLNPNNQTAEAPGTGLPSFPGEKSIFSSEELFHGGLKICSKETSFALQISRNTHMESATTFQISYCISRQLWKYMASFSSFFLCVDVYSRILMLDLMFRWMQGPKYPYFVQL